MRLPTCLLLSCIFVFTQFVSANPSTSDISANYLQKDFALKFDELDKLYADDVLFSDPTGDVFGPPLADGPVISKDKVIAMQKSWGVSKMEFTESMAFSVGEYSVHFGDLAVQYQGSQDKPTFPFATIHRVKDKKIKERHDFGGYVDHLIGSPELTRKSEATLKTAKIMLRAYLSGDLETQNMLLADNTWFRDPTAEIWGVEFAQPIASKTDLLARRKDMYTRVNDFSFNVTKEFSSNNHAVFVGDISYTLNNKQKYNQKAIMVFEVNDGLITKHWDFVDYSVGELAE